MDTQNLNIETVSVVIKKLIKKTTTRKQNEKGSEYEMA